MFGFSECFDLQGNSVIWAVCPGNGPVPNASGMAEKQPGVWLGKGTPGKLLAPGYLGGILAVPVWAL